MREEEEMGRTEHARLGQTAIPGSGVKLEGADPEKVYAVCPYIRNLLVCKRCDPWRDVQHIGRMKRGCYALAEEVVNIVETGNAWRRP